MRLTCTGCPQTETTCRGLSVTRTLRVDPDGADERAVTIRSDFLGTLVAREVVGRLRAHGERVAWRVTAYGQTGPSRSLAPVSLVTLRRAASTIAARAARAGWTLAPIELYTTSGGAMVITVRFDESHAADQSRHRIRDDALRAPAQAAGGQDVGASARELGAATRAPAWLEHAPTRIVVTIQHAIGSRTRTVSVSCGKAGTSPVGTCRQRFRERAVLFSPVQSDTTCIGGLTDESSLSGTVAGVKLERSFSNCDGGVTGTGCRTRDRSAGRRRRRSCAA
jgi:hypothetical protein